MTEHRRLHHPLAGRAGRLLHALGAGPGLHDLEPDRPAPVARRPRPGSSMSGRPGQVPSQAARVSAKKGGVQRGSTGRSAPGRAGPRRRAATSPARAPGLGARPRAGAAPRRSDRGARRRSYATPPCPVTPAPAGRPSTRCPLGDSETRGRGLCRYQNSSTRGMPVASASQRPGEASCSADAADVARSRTAKPRCRRRPRAPRAPRGRTRSRARSSSAAGGFSDRDRSRSWNERPASGHERGRRQRRRRAGAQATRGRRPLGLAGRGHELRRRRLAGRDRGLERVAARRAWRRRRGPRADGAAAPSRGRRGSSRSTAGSRPGTSAEGSIGRSSRCLRVSSASVLPSKARRPVYELVEQQAERVDVAADGDLAPLELLRRHVGGRPRAHVLVARAPRRGRPGRSR